MKRQRNSPPAGLRLGTLVLAMGLCVFFSGAGVGYVWHRNRNDRITAHIREERVRLQELRSQNEYADRQLESLRSFRVLEQAVERWNLGLVMPQPDQILRITETAHGAVPGPAPASSRLGAAVAQR